MGARDIYCKDCERFEPGTGKKQPDGNFAGRCLQYNADVMPDNFLMNCPGAVRITESRVPAKERLITPPKEETTLEVPVEETEPPVEGWDDPDTDADGQPNPPDAALFEKDESVTDVASDVTKPVNPMTGKPLSMTRNAIQNRKKTAKKKKKK